MKKNVKQILSILLTLIMLVGMIPISAFAENGRASGTDSAAESNTGSTAPAAKSAQGASRGELIPTSMMVVANPKVVDPSETVTIAFVITSESGSLPPGTINASQFTFPQQAPYTIYSEFNGGEIYIPALNLSPGVNSLELKWSGSAGYAPCKTTIEIKVAEKKSIGLEDYEVVLGEPGEPYTISGRFIVGDDDPLEEEEFTLRTQQEPGSTSMLPWFVKTDEDGYFSYTVEQNLSFISPGDTLDVELFVESTDKHLSFRKRDKISFKTHTSIDFSTAPGRDYCDVDEKYVANFVLNGSPDSQMNWISVKLDGIVEAFEYMVDSNLYSLVLNDPRYSLETGRHTLEIVFSGTDTLAPCSHTFVFTVKNKNDPAPHSVTYKIENGVWITPNGKEFQITDRLPHGYTITAVDLPVPKPDLDFGLGKWDRNPVGQTVTQDAEYTLSYMHHTVSYVMLGGGDSIGSAPPAVDTEWWDSGSIEVLGSDALDALPTLLDEKYDFGGTWYVDRECNLEADAWTEVNGDVTLYGRWTGPYEVIDQVLLNFTPPTVGDPIPTGQYYADGIGDGLPSELGVTQPSSMDGKTLVYMAAYELEDDQGPSFKAGETYWLSVIISPADPTKQRFKGHGGGDSFSLSVEGTSGAGIEYVGGTQTLLWIEVTPKSKTPAGTAIISYDLNGGTMDGKTGTVTAEAEIGSTITLPAPTREGYSFVNWGDPAWKAGAGYEVEGDHSFTAQWQENGQHTHQLTLVEAAEAGCTQAGNSAYYTCDSCDLWFEDAAGAVEITDKKSVIIPALGHTWSPWKQTKAPTALKKGEETRVCTRCGEEETRSIPARGSDDDDDDDDDSGSRTGARGTALESGSWMQTADGWTYRLSAGGLATGWHYLSSGGRIDWYFFDSRGVMQTGWLDFEGSRYYLNPVSNGYMGAMQTGWQLIEGRWYYFETVAGQNLGHMYVNRVTPDGYRTGSDGAWDGNPAAGR